MPMFDFSHEGEQRERNYGPVPGGSIVIVKMTALEPNPEQRASGMDFVRVAQTGLFQLWAQFEVERGQYQGVQWRQYITLPAQMQAIMLGPKQEIACRIGGAQIRAILEAARRPPRVESFGQMSGLIFPVKVTISDRYSEKDGKIYWRNEIDRIITPDKPQYQEIRQKGEIINPDGPVVGKPQEGWQAESSGNSGANGAAANNGNGALVIDPFGAFPPRTQQQLEDSVPF